MTYLRLRPAINSHPLNAYREGNEEHLQLRVRQQQALLGRISQFVYLTGSGTNPQAQEQLALCIALLPPGVCQPKLHDIVAETSGDGPGVLSTLTALTYVHYIYSLPTPLGEEVETAISLVQFNCVAYGWLSNRVLEAIIYMLMRAGLSALAISQRLQPVLDEVSRDLAVAQLPEAILTSKWNGRALLRQEAGIEA